MNDAGDLLTVVRGRELLWAELDGQVILMSPVQGNYYQLNATASRMWHLTEKPMSSLDIANVLHQEFDVNLQDCLGQVEAFLSTSDGRVIFERAEDP